MLKMYKLSNVRYFYPDVKTAIYFKGDLRVHKNVHNKLYVGRYVETQDDYGKVIKGYYFPRRKIIVVEEESNYVEYKVCNIEEKGRYYHRQFQFAKEKVSLVETNISYGKIFKYTWEEEKDDVTCKEVECFIRICCGAYSDKEYPYFYTRRGYLDVTKVKVSSGDYKTSVQEVNSGNLSSQHSAVVYFEHRLSKKEELIMKSNFKNSYAVDLNRGHIKYCADTIRKDSLIQDVRKKTVDSGRVSNISFTEMVELCKRYGGEGI